jgi:nucleotide-binding universal stress UspA family protein
MFPIRTILVPTDFSAASAAAFQLACSLARDHGSRILAVHAVPTPVAPYDMGGWVAVEPEGYREELLAKLKSLRPGSPEVGVEYRLADGDPPAEIVRIAKETPCDLIVMGTHGRTGLARLVLGSVAEEVLRKAPCPVVTVKSGPPRAGAAGMVSPEAVVAADVAR